MPAASDPTEETRRLLAELTLEEKASLVLGSDIWHTAPVERLGVPALTLSDGPHGLRRQPDEGDHVGIGGSLPATCYAVTWLAATNEQAEGPAINLAARSTIGPACR